MRLVLILILALGACTGQRPLGQIQFCLTKQSDRAELVRTLQKIAHDEGLNYFDRSQETGQELVDIGAAKSRDIRRSFPVMNVTLDREDGLGLGGGNIGLPTDQIGFGFSVGEDRTEAIAFMRRVTARLKQKWDVHEMSGEVGMFPIDCSRTQATKVPPA